MADTNVHFDPVALATDEIDTIIATSPEWFAEIHNAFILDYGQISAGEVRAQLIREKVEKLVAENPYALGESYERESFEDYFAPFGTAWQLEQEDRY